MKSTIGNGIVRSGGGKIVSGQMLSSGRDMENALAVGSLIGNHYRIIKLIAEGGTSPVYLVKDENQKDDTLFAMKANRNISARTSQESQLLIVLSNTKPHIVRTVNMGHDEHTGLDYIVMEYVKGVTFARIIEKALYLTNEECLVVAYEVCQAMEALEICKIIHGDIKPSNIMLDENGIVYLTDFGSAVSLKRHDEIGRRPSPPVLPQNGTPLYESPEQWRRKPNIDFRTDIYSLGATLYELSTGLHPFPGDTTNEVFTYRAKHPMPVMTPRHANPSLSKGFSELIMNMMAVDPEDRPGTSSYLLEALVELGCPEYEEDRTEIMQNLLTREPSALLPPPKKDYSIVIKNILKIAGLVLLSILLFFICLK